MRELVGLWVSSEIPTWTLRSNSAEEEIEVAKDLVSQLTSSAVKEGMSVGTQTLGEICGWAADHLKSISASRLEEIVRRLAVTQIEVDCRAMCSLRCFLHARKTGMALEPATDWVLTWTTRAANLRYPPDVGTIGSTRFIGSFSGANLHETAQEAKAAIDRLGKRLDDIEESGYDVDRTVIQNSFENAAASVSALLSPALVQLADRVEEIPITGKNSSLSAPSLARLVSNVQFSSPDWQRNALAFTHWFGSHKKDIDEVSQAAAMEGLNGLSVLRRASEMIRKQQTTTSAASRNPSLFLFTPTQLGSIHPRLNRTIGTLTPSHSIIEEIERCLAPTLVLDTRPSELLVQEALTTLSRDGSMPTLLEVLALCFEVPGDTGIKMINSRIHKIKSSLQFLSARQASAVGSFALSPSVAKRRAQRGHRPGEGTRYALLDELAAAVNG